MENIKINTFENGVYDDGDIIIDDVSITYTQNGDCTENESDVQTMVLSSRNNGTARFVNIKTDNWSIGDSSEFIDVIKDFCKRAGIEFFDTVNGDNKSENK